MPLFLFRIEDDRSTANMLGLDLSTPEDVKREAIRTAAGYMLESKLISSDWSISASDEEGHEVVRVTFSIS